MKPFYITAQDIAEQAEAEKEGMTLEELRLMKMPHSVELVKGLMEAGFSSLTAVAIGRNQARKQRYENEMRLRARALREATGLPESD